MGHLERLTDSGTDVAGTAQRLTMLASKERGSDQERLTELIEADKVTPSIDRTYPLEQVLDALRHLESGAVRGKVAITISAA